MNSVNRKPSTMCPDGTRFTIYTQFYLRGVPLERDDLRLKLVMANMAHHFPMECSLLALMNSVNRKPGTMCPDGTRFTIYTQFYLRGVPLERDDLRLKLVMANMAHHFPMEGCLLALMNSVNRKPGTMCPDGTRFTIYTQFYPRGVPLERDGLRLKLVMANMAHHFPMEGCLLALMNSTMCPDGHVCSIIDTVDQHRSVPAEHLWVE